jgi:CRP/FNR family cyclic AMP-dependent transcriptional regulator
METAQHVSIADLKEVDIFAELSDEDLEEISKYCSLRSYRAGEYAAVQGKSTELLMIMNGGKAAVEMWVEVPRDNYTITIATLTKGRVCAWSALVPPNVLTASIKCIENTPMITIHREDFERILAAKPTLAAAVMRKLAGVISSRLRDSNTQLTNLSAEILKEGMKHRE